MKISRIAGQFAKPRSSDSETKDGVTLPSYRGDIINASSSTKSHASPIPRARNGLSPGEATLNLLRAFAQGDFANINNVHRWMLGFISDSPQAERYQVWRPHLGSMIGVGDRHHRRTTIRSARPILHQPRALLLGSRSADASIDLRRLVRDLRSDLDRRSRASRITPTLNTRGIKNPLGLKWSSLTEDGC